MIVTQEVMPVVMSIPKANTSAAAAVPMDVDDGTEEGDDEEEMSMELDSELAGE